MSFIRKIKRNGRIYLAEVETKRDGVKVTQKLIKYLGVEPEKNLNIFNYNHTDKIEDIKIYGSVVCLDYIASQLGLHKLFGKNSAAILSLVYCHCHNYKSLSDVSDWFLNTDLSKIFNLDKITENDLREAILELNSMDKNHIEKSIFEKMCLLFDEKKPSSIVYDVTNTYFYGSSCELASKGKDKDGVKNRKLIQIGLCLTKENRIPIFHQVHKGNTHDVKIFEEAIYLLKKRKISRGTIIHDRGITSKSNVLSLTSSNWKLIAGISLNKKIKDIILNLDLDKMKNYRNRVLQGSTTFHVMIKKYKFGNVFGKLIILENPLKKALLREDRYQKITDEKVNFIKTNKYSPELKKYFTDNNKINSHKIKREEILDGFSVLFTNSKLTKTEIINQYFEKDIIEKAFQQFKGTLAIRPIRFWLEKNVHAHIMICYISFALMTTFRFQLNKNQQNPYLKGLTVEKALKEMSRVQRVYFSKKDKKNEQFSKIVMTTTQQKSIFQAICPDVLKV